MSERPVYRKAFRQIAKRRQFTGTFRREYFLRYSRKMFPKNNF